MILLKEMKINNPENKIKKKLEFMEYRDKVRNELVNILFAYDLVKDTKDSFIRTDKRDDESGFMIDMSNGMALIIIYIISLIFIYKIILLVI